MKQLMIVFLLFIVQNTFAQDVYNYTDENGMKQGYWVYLGKDRPETGIPPEGKVEEGNYVDDKKEGIWIRYHNNGATPKLKGEYENNRPYGHYTKYYPNGKIKERGYFIKNKNLDTLERFFENGKLEFFATYDSTGKEHGTIRKYNFDGSLNCEYEAVHGTIPNRPACLPPIVHCPIPIEPKEIGPIYLHEDQLTTPSTIGPINLEPIHLAPLEGKVNTKGIRWQPNGYNKVYNEDGEIWQDGIFKEGRLWDGKVYVYSQEGLLLKVKIYKHGDFHSDGQL
ncbi:MAG: hypothetical protein QE487_15750 [Fluviicola sp.]|nr:hypothetical protein [Fluviicola sp.]